MSALQWPELSATKFYFHVIALIIAFTSALISKFANAWELFLLTFGITCGLGVSFLIWVDVRAETDEEVLA